MKQLELHFTAFHHLSVHTKHVQTKCAVRCAGTGNSWVPMRPIALDSHDNGNKNVGRDGNEN